VKKKSKFNVKLIQSLFVKILQQSCHRHVYTNLQPVLSAKHRTY